ncbi:hypothetical protein CesoFtcFv8_026436 [Champsocephalus esox]|uniref:Uncharacterized protein n=1 Tax=Champsocephalus esox TaxID=159716 RepID=A0AAN8GDV3_9TELE|nr:hypothetical protein CesoFtcFv8_026436 [Champsocephalus esox]
MKRGLMRREEKQRGGEGEASDAELQRAAGLRSEHLFVSPVTHECGTSWTRAATGCPCRGAVFCRTSLIC